MIAVYMDSVYEIENYSASPNSEDEVKVPNFTKESNSSYVLTS
jgi:hypothetical protein